MYVRVQIFVMINKMGYVNCVNNIFFVTCELHHDKFASSDTIKKTKVITKKRLNYDKLSMTASHAGSASWCKPQTNFFCGAHVVRPPIFAWRSLYEFWYFCWHRFKICDGVYWLTNWFCHGLRIVTSLNLEPIVTIKRSTYAHPQ